MAFNCSTHALDLQKNTYETFSHEIKNNIIAGFIFVLHG